MQKVRTGRGQGVYNDEEAVSQIVIEGGLIHVPMDSTCHVSGSVSLVSAEASRGSSPATVKADMIAGYFVSGPK